MERKWLSVRFGLGLVYYMDGVQIPEPAELALSEEEVTDGVAPEVWGWRLHNWAHNNGVTHIWDDNVAEDGWPNDSGEEITLPRFCALLLRLYGV